MPAPLVMPAIRYSTEGEEGSLKVLEINLGKVSVVQIALAVRSQWSWVDPSALCAAGTFFKILSMGNLEIPRVRRASSARN